MAESKGGAVRRGTVRAVVGSVAVLAAVVATLVASPAPAGAVGAKSLVSIGSGGTFSCGLATDNTIICWGRGTSGELGDGLATNSLTPVQVKTAGTPLAGKTIAQVSVGAIHACALTTDGVLACWGSASTGRLGNGTNFGKNVEPGPVTIAGTPLAGKTITYVEAGGFGTCVVASGAPYCWGADNLGNESSSAFVPTAVTTAGTPLQGKTVVSVAHGTSSTCALTSTGEVACWGANTAGSLGNGTTTPSNVPVALATAGTPLAGKQIAQVTRNGIFFHCARTTDSVLACWGNSDNGRLGNGDAVNDRSTPVAVTVAGTPLEGKTIIDLQGGEGHACAVASDGTTACWGWDVDGALGNGSPAGTDASVPVAVQVGGTALAGKVVRQTSSSSSVGHATTCALLAGGTAACWGYNNYGQLGNGSVSSSPVAVAVGGLVEAAPPTVPGTPTGVSAAAGNGQATVQWSAPTSNGGALITGYVVTPYVGGVAQPSVASSGTGTSKVVSGLSNGTAYSFRVAAVNSVGTGAQSAASSAVTPTAPAVPYAPFASWGALVDRLHLDLTTKAPTSSARSTWVSQLGVGSKTQGDLADALRRSPENVANVDPVVRVYRAFLGRAPDAGGLKFWIKRKRNVAPAKTWSVTQIATEFTNSSEFKAKYGSLTNRQFVTQIYTDVLGRTADPSGVDYWTGKLDRMEKTKAQVVVGFSESNEYKTKQAQNTDVAVAYIYLLGRAPTTAEASDWVTRQKAGTTHADLLTELLTSAKYATYITG